MTEEERRFLVDLLARGEARPDIAIIYVVQAVLELHNVVDGLVQDVSGPAPAGGVDNPTVTGYAGQLAHVREMLEIALKAGTGRNYGG